MLIPKSLERRPLTGLAVPPIYSVSSFTVARLQGWTTVNLVSPSPAWWGGRVVSAYRVGQSSSTSNAAPSSWGQGLGWIAPGRFDSSPFGVGADGAALPGLPARVRFALTR